MEAQFYLFFFIINYSVWPVSAPWLTVDIAKSMDLACCKGSVFLCDWLASYCAGSHCEWCPLSISTMRGRSFLKRYLVMHSLALTLHLRTYSGKCVAGLWCVHSVAVQGFHILVQLRKGVQACLHTSYGHPHVFFIEAVEKQQTMKIE